jgi:tRNA G18 (ribose-2'-O)-methylase SpoU
MIETKKMTMDELGRKSVEQFKSSEKIPIVIVLDNVRSLHNIGSIFRTCDAFLVEAVYLCGICAKPPHNEIHKTALGAEDSVEWKYFEKTVEALKYLKSNNYINIGIEQTHGSISLEMFSLEPERRYAVVFGNEVHGIEQEVINHCDAFVEIPQFGTKHSFNVAISAGIVLWEFYKKLKPCK